MEKPSPEALCHQLGRRRNEMRPGGAGLGTYAAMRSMPSILPRAIETP